MKKPSPAQARMLASMFGGSTYPLADTGYDDPTRLCLRARGWIEPNGKTSEWANGVVAKHYSLNEAGVTALATYLAAYARRPREPRR